MSYRTDPDLSFLQYADNDDLLLLADTLMFKDVKHKEKKQYRATSTLQKDINFKKCYPKQMRGLWMSIAEELQKFGGHSGVNWLFRLNKGILYREILTDVCKLQKVRNIDFKKDGIAKIENALLEKTVELIVEKMSESDRKELINGLKHVDDFKAILWDNPGILLADLIKLVFKQGGFKSYILTLQLVNGISKAVVGRGLSFGANAALTKYIGSFMSGPLGWAFAVITTLWSFMGPNKNVCLRSCVIVAYMRKKKMLGY